MCRVICGFSFCTSQELIALARLIWHCRTVLQEFSSPCQRVLDWASEQSDPDNHSPPLFSAFEYPYCYRHAVELMTMSNVWMICTWTRFCRRTCSSYDNVFMAVFSIVFFLFLYFTGSPLNSSCINWSSCLKHRFIRSVEISDVCANWFACEPLQPAVTHKTSLCTHCRHCAKKQNSSIVWNTYTLHAMKKEMFDLSQVHTTPLTLTVVGSSIVHQWKRHVFWNVVNMRLCVPCVC